MKKTIENQTLPGDEGLTSAAARFVEEGAAFVELTARKPPRVEEPSPAPETLDVVVIGGGQAGLSVGYHLARRGLRFVVLEKDARIGEQWRRRWDSLRLFTPARFSSLDGMPFPAPPDSFPTKDAMADYLEAYAGHFSLPVRTGVRVERVWREKEGGYVVRAGGREIRARHVVVAMANYQRPKIPAFARELRPEIVQIHSSDYKNPSQLREGAVLLVGAGNSGSEIAMELSRHHRVLMSGRDTGHLPFRPSGFAGRVLLVRVVLKGLFHHVLTVKTPIGRKARPHVLSQGGPLIRVMPKDLAAAGVERVPRTGGTQDGWPRLADGRVLDGVANVVWCTGFDPGFSWIDLPVFDERGEPRHAAGVVEDEPGLYFVGLHFLYAMSSAMIHGVGRDAARIADAIAARVGAARGSGARTTAATAA
jgi:putative flavoprotein involved in K+ transport